MRSTTWPSSSLAPGDVKTWKRSKHHCSRRQSPKVKSKTEKQTSAQAHGGDRLWQGSNQVQGLAEFRALRATVIRLWMNSSPPIDDSAMYQLIRFDEGIDQAVSESTARFMDQLEKSSDFATAVLAHVLRNLLHAVLSSAHVLQLTESIDRATISQIGANIVASGRQMGKLIDNVLDFTDSLRPASSHPTS
jgi:signal transduction histidine kinase